MGLLWSLEALTAWLTAYLPSGVLTESAFVQAFHSLANEFCQKGNPGIQAFLEWWQLEAAHDIQTPSGKDAITIITVHKSKGLEFPVVMIPSCDFGLRKNRDSTIWANADAISETSKQSFEKEGIQFPSGPVLLKWNAKLGNSLYGPGYKLEKELDGLETLNLFYVALTRAKSELYLWSNIKVTQKETSPLSDHLGGYFYAYFQGQSLWPLLTDASIPGHSYCCIGTPRSHYVSEFKTVDTEIPYQSYPRHIALKVHPYAKRHPGEEDLMESPRTYGILMHRILECLESPDSIMSLLTDERLQDVPEQDLATGLRKIEKAVQNPVAFEWFHPGWTLYREAEIMIPGTSRVLRPDRVMMKEDEVIIVDYKFGEQALSQQEKHIAQIRQYREQIQAMEPQKKKIKLYLWYIDQDCIQEVH